MELIYISGYTLEEKMKIFKHYLLPKQLFENGLKNSNITIDDDNIKDIIELYTYESGIRNLERNLAKIMRYIIKILMIDKKFIKRLDTYIIKKILGRPRYISKYNILKIYQSIFSKISTFFWNLLHKSILQICLFSHSIYFKLAAYQPSII